MALTGAILPSCNKTEDAIYIRVHNASAEEYVTIHVDPTAGLNQVVDFGGLQANGTTAYIQVPKSAVLAIIDVGCLYNTYHYEPITPDLPVYEDPNLQNAPGHYTYHIGLADNNGEKHLTLYQTAD